MFYVSKSKLHTNTPKILFSKALDAGNLIAWFSNQSLIYSLVAFIKQKASLLNLSVSY